MKNKFAIEGSEAGSPVAGRLWGPQAQEVKGDRAEALFDGG